MGAWEIGFAGCATAFRRPKTNLLFFTKGKKTERIWYYGLSHVKVGKKTPLTLAHFGFDKDGKAFGDKALPANLIADAFAVIDSLEPISDYVFAAGPEQPGYQGLPGLWETVQKTSRLSAEAAAKAPLREDP